MSIRSKFSITVLLGAVAILGVGCEGNDAGPEVTATPTVASTLAAEVTDAIPSGTTFAFVRGVEGGALILDPAAFLSGDEALAAAREDGFVGADEELPNDFYIRNLEQEALSVPLADAAMFTLIGFDATGGLADVEVDRATLEALLTGGDASAYYGFIATDLPMTLDIEGGEVTGGRQQYLP
jgi:hypothetical protein